MSREVKKKFFDFVYLQFCSTDQMRLLHLYASGGILKQGESRKFARY